MANTLISPIYIESSPYCCAYTSGRRTRGVVTNGIISGTNLAVITTLAGPWNIIQGSSGDVATIGEISFGVSCGAEVEVLITIVSGDSTDIANLEAFINGVSFGTGVVEMSGTTTKTFYIPVTCSPCGTIITLTAYGSSEFAYVGMVVTAEVVGIT